MIGKSHRRSQRESSEESQIESTMTSKTRGIQTGSRGMNQSKTKRSKPMKTAAREHHGRTFGKQRNQIRA